MVRLAAIAAALTAVTIPLVACSSSDDLDDPTVEQPASSGGVADDAMPTGVAFPVGDPRNGSDGVSDELYDVAAAGDTVVAVGGIDSPRVTQPVVIVSKDGGHTWRPATLEGLDGRSNESVETVSHGAHGWVGIGYDADGVPVSWTSADGVTWTRRGSSGFVLADTVGVVAASDAGFVAGGSFDRGRASVPATWFSPDGRKWQRTAAPGQQESEGAWINGIATFGHRAVAVGSTSDGGMDEGRAWISADGGRTWRTEDIFGTSVYDVTALTHYGQLKGPAFIAVGKQSYIPFPGYRDIPDSGWEPDVDFRVDSNADVRGGPWLGEAISTRPTAGDQELYAAAPLGSGLVVAGVDRRSNSRVDAFVYRDARNGWRRVTGPSLRGPGEQSVNAAAASGSSSVMVGYDERSGDRSAAAWIVRPGGKVIEIRGRQLLDVPPPNPEVYDVATGDDGRLTAVGAVGDHAAAWTSDDGQTWQQVTLPDAAAAAESWATEVTHGRRGWLVVGQDGYLRSRSVAVWRSHDGRSWRRVDELTRPIEYDYNDANGLAFTGRGYVVGGSSSRGGYFDNGAVWWSGDGSRWRATPSVGEDDDHKRTAARHGPAAALFGGIRRDVVIYDVVPAATGGVIASGSVETADLDRPAVWTSQSPRSWVRSPLPMPKACRSAYASYVRMSDSGGIVAAGGCSTAAGAPDRPVFWHRAGQGWTVAMSPTRESPPADVYGIVRVGGSWVAVGSMGSGDRRDAVTWTSTDGMSWDRVDIDESFGGSGNQALSSPVVIDGRVFAVFSSIAPTGDLTLLLREVV